jgi:hypothetical protein
VYIPQDIAYVTVSGVVAAVTVAMSVLGRIRMSCKAKETMKSKKEKL